MAEGKQRLLYADLFKSPITSSKSESQASSWTSEYSFSSYVADSDICSDNDDDDGDFIDQLSREMAERMLKEDRDEFIPDSASEDSEGGKNYPSSYPEPAVSFQIKNPPPYGKSHGRNPVMQGRTGSGMRAIFLQSSPRSPSSGTGVFFPRVDTTPVEIKKKTVLIPNRVLKILELHHNKSSHQIRVLLGSTVKMGGARRGRTRVDEMTICCRNYHKSGLIEQIRRKIKWEIFSNCVEDLYK